MGVSPGVVTPEKPELSAIACRPLHRCLSLSLAQPLFRLLTLIPPFHEFLPLAFESYTQHGSALCRCEHCWTSSHRGYDGLNGQYTVW
jgi:hypothetical protein